jgi:hypothetical protein
VFLQKREASPAACSVRSRNQQKSFLFLLEEKIGARKSGKAKKTFLLAGERQRAAAGRLHWFGFSSKKVRISSKQYRFVREKPRFGYTGI